MNITSSRFLWIAVNNNLSLKIYDVARGTKNYMISTFLLIFVMPKKYLMEIRNCQLPGGSMTFLKIEELSDLLPDPLQEFSWSSRAFHLSLNYLLLHPSMQKRIRADKCTKFESFPHRTSLSPRLPLMNATHWSLISRQSSGRLMMIPSAGSPAMTQALYGELLALCAPQGYWLLLFNIACTMWFSINYICFLPFNSVHLYIMLHPIYIPLIGLTTHRRCGGCQCWSRVMLRTLDKNFWIN